MTTARTARAKVPTNLSVRADLVRSARALGPNLSEVLETALEQAVRDRARAAWQAENQDAIDGYNARVERHGVFSDAWRKF
jgi:antitoxin CcdA